MTRQSNFTNGDTSNLNGVEAFFMTLVKDGKIQQMPANYDCATLKMYISHLENENAELKAQLKNHRLMIMADGTVKQFYNTEEVEQIVKGRDELRAELLGKIEQLEKDKVGLKEIIEKENSKLKAIIEKAEFPSELQLGEKLYTIENNTDIVEWIVDQVRVDLIFENDKLENSKREYTYMAFAPSKDFQCRYLKWVNNYRVQFETSDIGYRSRNEAEQRLAELKNKENKQ